RRIIKDQSGFNLGPDKQDMLEARLRPLLKDYGHPSIAHFTLAALKPDAYRLRARLAQAASIQESYFFRDKVPFHYFIDAMLPRLMACRQSSRHVRIWCAAAATGQEPYSLATAVDDHDAHLQGWPLAIIPTALA